MKPADASAQTTEYRPDIDGLRAVAVLGVLAFHAFPRVLPGGFIGVDVFFVISGFLISSILFEALRRDRFSYVEFYVRRIRRIFPALLAVLGACLIGGWFLLLPDEYKQLGRQVAAGAGFAANVLFWSQAGYFDTDASIKPLLHLWSLGIEEQYYLGWPLLLALLYRRARAHLPLLMGLLLVGSFVVNVLYVDSRPSATFYLPLARFWELLSGSLLAYALLLRPAALPQLSRGWREGLALSGLGLIGAGLLWIDPQRAFPGWWALLPVAGTMLLIVARTGWVNRVLLSNRVMVFVGLISYPLYLWHWVLLAIVRIRLYADGAEAPRLERVLLLGVSVLLAWATYELIEKPIRFGTRARWKPVALLAGMGVVALAGVVVDASDGAAFRYPAAIRPLAAYQYDKERERYSAVLTGRSCFIEGIDIRFSQIGANCTDKPDDSKPLVVLWGDSHAAALYAGLKAVQDRDASFRIAQYTANACAPVLGWEYFQHGTCRAFNDAAFERIASLHPYTVVLEGAWWFYCTVAGGWSLDLSALQATVRRLQSVGVRRVVVFGDLPVWQIPQPKIGVKLWLDTHSLPERTHAYFNATSARVDAQVRDAVAQTGAVFVSPIDALCDERGCLLTTDRNRWTPLAWDAAHLTEAGSIYLVSRAADELLGRPATGQQ
jgi:peptidoglycan/LPS O-acetylase OafA/YrhL